MTRIGAENDRYPGGGQIPVENRSDANEQDFVVRNAANSPSSHAITIRSGHRQNSRELALRTWIFTA